MSTARRHPASEFGYVEGDTLDKVVVARLENWLAEKDSGGGQPPPYMFCYASRRFFSKEDFSHDQQRTRLGQVRVSMHKPDGMRHGRWKEIAEQNMRDGLNCMDSSDERNRAFAVFLHRNTRLLLKDDKGEFIQTSRATPGPERKRKQ